MATAPVAKFGCGGDVDFWEQHCSERE